MIFRLWQVSQNIPEDELMLFHSLCFILSSFVHCIISLCSTSTWQGTQSQRKSGTLAQPQRMCSLEGGKAGLLDERRSFQPQKLSYCTQQPEVFLKSAGVLYNSIRNQLELVSNYGKHLQSVCKFNCTKIIIELNYKASKDRKQC